jgi:ABC-type lipoprotein export system ATPase subunit
VNKTHISTHDIKKTFIQAGNPVMIVNGVTFFFEQGMRYVITGASGSGKSTFLHMLAGLEKPTEGYVAYHNERIDQYSSAQKELFYNQHIGILFQQPYLIPELSVLENVMIKGILAKKNNDEVKKEALELLERVGIADKAYVLPGTLSGGQQHRAALARALCNRPRFLLADEPTGNLDAKTGAVIIDLVLAYQEEYAMGLIISSHDPEIKKRMHTVLTIQDGFLI